MDLINSEITDKIIKAFYAVYNDLGYGFLERVYENALFNELTDMGLDCERQKPIDVFYKEEKVGSYFAEFILEDSVIIELKAAEGIAEEHEFQLINYLKATEIEVGLLLNFGKKPQFKRKVFTNKRVENINPF